jgi:hypothetical protein
MVWIDTGYRYGDSSIGRWVRLEHKRGHLRHERCAPGWRFHRTGMQTHNGTTLNRYPSEAERRESLWRAKIERRRQRRDRVRALQRAAEDKRRAERDRRRRREVGPELVRRGLEAPPELATPAERSSALAGILGALVAPRLAASSSATRSTTPAAPSRSHREIVDAEIERARALAREFGELEPDDGES